MSCIHRPVLPNNMQQYEEILVCIFSLHPVSVLYRMVHLRRLCGTGTDSVNFFWFSNDTEMLRASKSGTTLAVYKADCSELVALAPLFLS